LESHTKPQRHEGDSDDRVVEVVSRGGSGTLGEESGCGFSRRVEGAGGLNG
jgi:hypothetical protein